MAKQNAEELAAKRQSAAYLFKMDQLRRSAEDMTDAEMDRIALAAVDEAVFGFDAKRDRKGSYIPQGIGAQGHETGNHFASILRWQGKAAWEDAVREIWKRDPERAQKLGLPKLEKAA